MRKIFITGGTGSLGSRLVEFLYNNSDLEFIVFSRDEQKHFQMRLKYTEKIPGDENPRVHFVVGDIRDLDSITSVMEKYKPNYVVHTAAMKHIDICDQNPMQAVLTNINGTQNVAKACISTGVEAACFISTDKSVKPTTLYGMTKHIAERIWLNSSKGSTTKFFGVRYGNVVNSTGSLIPYYLTVAKSTKIFPLTNSEMTRFLITFDQAIAWIIYTFADYVIQLVDPFEVNLNIATPALHEIDKEIFFVPTLPSVKIKDIAEIFAEACGGTVKKTVVYPGEKMAEDLTATYSSTPVTMSKEILYQFLKKENLLPENK